MRRNALTPLAVMFLGLFLFSAPASANSVAPALVMLWGCFGVFVLVPIIIVEGVVLFLFGFSLWVSTGVAVIGNLVSAIVGIPIALDLAPVRKLLLSWLGADPETDSGFKILHWLGELLALLGFFFLTSWVIETTVALVVAGRWSQPSQPVFVANAVSYGLLFVVLVAIFGIALLLSKIRSRTPAKDMVGAGTEDINTTPATDRRLAVSDELSGIESNGQEVEKRKGSRSFANQPSPKRGRVV